MGPPSHSHAGGRSPMPGSGNSSRANLISPNRLELRPGSAWDAQTRPSSPSDSAATYTPTRWDAMTLRDGASAHGEKSARQFSEASSSAETLAMPGHGHLKEDFDKLSITEYEASCFTPRHSSDSRPMFDPHPAVRVVKKKNSVWMDEEDQASKEAGESVPPLPTPAVSAPSQGSGLWKPHEYLFVFSICLAQLFSLAALAQTFGPLLIISDSFGVTDPGQMSWYTAAFSMTLGTFILPAGRLGDMFGHKKIFLVGWLWFAVWSFITGFSYAGGPIMLSTCRAIQGIGPALLVPNGIALLGRTFPIGMKRAVAIALFGGCGPIGMTLGVVFSSMLSQLIWWPWSFWAMAAACVAAGILSQLVIPTDESRNVSVNPTADSKGQFDTLGSITGVSGLILINFALNQAPLTGWNEVYVPVLLVFGFLLMFTFVWVELYVAAKPIVPLRGLHRDAAFTLACIAAGWASHGIWNYYLYLLLMNIRKETALMAVSQTWPVAPIGFSAALAVPFMLKKVKVPVIMSLAMVAFAVCILLLATAPADQIYWKNTFLSMIIAPFAMNWSFPAGTILMSNAVAKKHQGVAASLIATTVNYSIATGLGIGGTIDRYTTPKHGVLGGYRGVWWFGFALALLGFVVSLNFIWQGRKSQKAG